VLGVECSNHSVLTILFKGLRDFISRPLFMFGRFTPTKRLALDGISKWYQRRNLAQGFTLRPGAAWLVN